MLLRSEQTRLLRVFNLDNSQASLTEPPCWHTAILWPASTDLTPSCGKKQSESNLCKFSPNYVTFLCFCFVISSFQCIYTKGSAFRTSPFGLTLSLLMSYIYGAPSKARNLTSYIYIYRRDFLLEILLLEPCISLTYEWKTNKYINYSFSLLITYGSSYMFWHYIAINRERS
jgi:hypothetical protein